MDMAKVVFHTEGKTWGKAIILKTCWRQLSTGNSIEKLYTRLAPDNRDMLMVKRLETVIRRSRYRSIDGFVSSILHVSPN